MNCLIDGINDTGYNGNLLDSDNSLLEEDDDIDSDDERFKIEDYSEEVKFLNRYSLYKYYWWNDLSFICVFWWYLIVGWRRC